MAKEMSELQKLVGEGSENTEQWIPALNAFNMAFKGIFTFEGEHKLEEDDKIKMVEFLRDHTKLDTTWAQESPEVVTAGLAAIKTITRTRSGLNPLFDTTTITELLKVAHHFRTSHSSVSEECAAILVNCCIINQDEMMRIFKEIDPFTAVVDKWLMDLIKESESFKAQYTSCRLLFYLTFEKDIAAKITEANKIYEFLVDMILIQAQDEIFYLDPKRCSFFCELLKVIFNLSTHEENKKSIVDYIPKERFEDLLKCVVGIMALPLASDPEFETKMKTIPVQPNLCFAKLQIINCFIYIRNDLSGQFINRQVLIGLGELLQYQALEKENPEPALAPLLLVLTGICRDSAPALHFFKSMIFGDKPPPEQEEGEELNMDPEPDDGVETIRTILLKHVTSFHMTLKHHVSEFLFTLCGRDSKEYIQRTGFGNAIGLLANKGFPGFENIQSRAIDLDQLAREKRDQDKNDKDEEKHGDS